MDTVEKNKLIKILDGNYKISQSSKLIKIIKKSSRFIFLYFFLFFNKNFPFLNLSNLIKVKSIWGEKMILIFPTYSSIFSLGFFEYRLTKFFIKNLKDDDIFIDGGANIGYYTLLASKLVGNNGKVISFEPTPSAFKILKKNTEEKTNIILEEKALLNKIGEIKFIDYGLKNSPLNSVIKRTTILENQGKEINVESITLDEYCFKNNIKPTFIKLDVEGSESLVLEGMKNILKNDKPIISIEVGGGKEWAFNNQKSISLLQSFNYKVYEIDENGELIDHKIKQEYDYDNLIFLPIK